MTMKSRDWDGFRLARGKGIWERGVLGRMVGMGGMGGMGGILSVVAFLLGVFLYFSFTGWMRN
jgi:hypothetical protein